MRIKKENLDEISITFTYDYAKQLVENNILDFGYDVVENTNSIESKKLKIMKWYMVHWNKKVWAFEVEVHTSTGDWKKFDVVTAKQFSESYGD